MLEDFFTLTEMKDGISAVARMGELVTEIQKLNTYVGLNTADMIRQCSTVANTLACTKNEDCLWHFVQLNGIIFLNRWLQDAQNCSEDVSTAAEDLIIAILTAFECLPIDNEQSTSCGVVSTVHNLVAHGNAEINNKARTLCHKWSSTPKCGTNCQNSNRMEACQVDQLKLPEASQLTENDKQSGADEVGSLVERSKPALLTCSDAPLSDPSLNNGNTDSTKQPMALTSPNSSKENAISGGMISSVSSPACHVDLENASIPKKTSASIEEGLATTGMQQTNSINVRFPGQDDAHVEVTKGAMFVNLFASRKMNAEDDVISTRLSIDKPEPFSMDKLHLEKDTPETMSRLAIVTRDLKDLSEGSTGKEEGPASSSSSDGMDVGNEFVLKRCVKSFGDSSKATETKVTALKGVKPIPPMDDDDTDALEVARLVAIEVEREVIDYRGPFCGSPDIKSRNADSPDLEAQRHPEPACESNANKSSSTSVDSGSSSSLKEDGSGITDGSEPTIRKHTRSVDLADFDLNENQCTEEPDCNPKSVLSNSVSLSTPIAVTASRGSSAFPARLHFEGELGWKGTAATSAFRPASPRRTPDADKSLSASSHKTSNMLFDLNVADSDSATSGEPLSTAILSASSDLASKDTSAATGVSGGLKLDLNFSYGDEENVIASNVPLLWNRQQFNSNLRQPSSSTSRQPAVRNFDLNDNTSVADGCAQGIDGSFTKTCARDMSDHSSVTIMGKKIVFGQKEHGCQQQHNFLGPSVDSRVPARSIQSYAHAHTPDSFSYPSQPAVSYHPAFYAPGGVPYMVDAKGAPIMLPLSSLGLGISHPSFSTRATPHSSTELGYYHHSMDFNYDLSAEGSRREVGNFWPVPYQGQTIIVDERTRNLSQGGSSGLVLKRKEPESGWDMFPRR